MAENVVVQLESASIEIAPGGSPVTITPRVINATSIVDSFTVEVLGGEGWLVAPPMQVRLLPGAQANASIQLSIPADRFVIAGPHTLSVRVASVADSRVQQTLPLPALVREVAGAVKLRLDPQVVTAGSDARFLVWVRNPGNAPVDLKLSAEEAKGLSTFAFEPERLEIPPRHEMASAVTVSTKRPVFSQDENRSFTVHADGAKASLLTTGTLAVRPVIGRRLLRVAKLLATALAVLAVAGVAFAMSANKLDVPKVTGKTQAEATQLLETAGFTVDVTTANSDQIPAGVVIDQTPVAGQKAKKGSVIALTVSVGPVQVEVPNVVGLSQADALIALQNAGLLASPGQPVTSELEPGTIVDQSPQPGEKVAKGSVVTLYASAGLEPVVVPDVTSQAQADAQALLEAAGFVVQVSEEYSDEAAAGLVIEQTPAAEASAPAGSIILLVVSRGGEPFAMPNVVGLTQEAAADMLTALGLTVVVTYDRSSADTNVIAQSPANGDQVARGTQVTITCGSTLSIVPRDIIIIPDL